MTKKKKSAAGVGVVLRRIKDAGTLKGWADFMAGVDPWKSSAVTSEQLFGQWMASTGSLRFFSGADPRGAKTPGFDNEHGLIVFSSEDARSFLETRLNGVLPAGYQEGGIIHSLATKTRRKGVGKYLLHAAERVISEKHPQVYLFVGESNLAALRFYKGAGYEETAKVPELDGSGRLELLLTKRLTT